VHLRLGFGDELPSRPNLDPTVDLRYGNWGDFDLSGADLRGFNFTGADLTVCL
jgi:uncharacterized protein YjbI with pentapeptide repeats